MKPNRSETRGVRGGVDGKECDLIDFRSEHGELGVSAEGEAATIAGRVLNWTVGAEERISRRESNAESEAITDRDGRVWARRVDSVVVARFCQWWRQRRREEETEKKESSHLSKGQKKAGSKLLPPIVSPSNLSKKPSSLWA